MRAALRPGNRGFTLIEMLIAIGLLAILATIAYPSYALQLRKSHRVEAAIRLTQLQQAQERWRSNHPAYAADLTALGLADADGERYRIAITHSSAHGYTAVAVAIASQAADTACTSLSLTLSGGDTAYGATGTGTPRACWNH